MIQTIENKHFKWIDIKAPTQEDLKVLGKNFKLHPLVLNQLVPNVDFPKIEKFDDYLFLVLFYPSFDIKTNSVVPLELDIIVSKKYIITNHYKDIVPLRFILDQCNLYEDKKEDYTKEGPGLLTYYIVRKFLTASFPKLSNVKEVIVQIENAIYNQNDYTKTVVKIAELQRDLIGFQKIIEPHKLVLTNLAEMAKEIFDKKTEPYFRHLINLYNHVENIAQSNEKTLSSLDTSNQSLLNTQTNEIIKVLTIFSVIVFPLTLLASLFGMNTNLPLVKHEHSFWIVLGIMAAGTLTMLSIFKTKKWI
ncbi:MAG: magnesium transporter CorA family protein [bacterium]|nr:magnesium transporter CorA family protein [bacterium]